MGSELILRFSLLVALSIYVKIECCIVQYKDSLTSIFEDDALLAAVFGAKGLRVREVGYATIDSVTKSYLKQKCKAISSMRASMGCQDTLELFKILFVISRSCMHESAIYSNFFRIGVRQLRRQSPPSLHFLRPKFYSGLA